MKIFWTKCSSPTPLVQKIVTSKNHIFHVFLNSSQLLIHGQLLVPLPYLFFVFFLFVFVLYLYFHSPLLLCLFEYHRSLFLCVMWVSVWPLYLLVETTALIFFVICSDVLVESHTSFERGPRSQTENSYLPREK